MRLRSLISIVAATAAATGLSGAPDGASAPLATLAHAPPLPNSVIAPGSAAQLAAAMDVPIGAIRSAAYNGSDPVAFGIGTAPLGRYFPSRGDTFAILSTGFAQDADTPNDSEYLSYELDGLNNVGGWDLAQLVLRLGVPATSTCITFDVAFYSEEYPEFVGSEYNDAFTAEFGGTSLSISGTKVMASLNFVVDPSGGLIDVSTSYGLVTPTMSTYDGVTPLIRASKAVTPGTTITLVLSVQDMGDSAYDSAVFADNFRFGTESDCGGPAPTATPTATAGPSPTATATSAAGLTPTPTRTPLPTASPTQTPTGQATASPMPSSTPTRTPTSTTPPTTTPTATSVSTSTPTLSAPSATPTDTPMPTPTPTSSQTASATDTPTATPTALPAASMTPTPSATATLAMTETPTTTPDLIPRMYLPTISRRG